MNASPAFLPVENGESGDLYDVVWPRSLDCTEAFHVRKENDHAGAVDKKNIHSTSERVRRRRMITCLLELKSLLPSENDKNRVRQRKISASDILWKATDYISHLQGKVDELTKKKADMKTKGVQKSYLYKEEKDFPIVNVSQVCSDVLITTDTRIEEMVLSKLRAAVEGQGLQVLTASSFTTHHRVTYTLTCKVCPARSFHGSTKLSESIWNLMRQRNISPC